MLESMKLHSGASIPSVGLGTWKSTAEEVGEAVATAVDFGYRHLDCAYAYCNEKQIGEVLNNVFNDPAKGVQRGDMFLTTKLWNSNHHPGDVKVSCKRSISNLQCDYIDLYLMHWPMAYKRGDDILPTGPEGKIEGSDIDYLDTYKAMEELVDDGLCNHIGVSNFNLQQLKRVVENSRIKPSVLQVECHPYLNQSELLNYCQSRGIVLEAYSPLGSPDRPGAEYYSGDVTPLLKHPEISRIAAGVGRSVAQVLIRFQVQRGVVVLPKSVNPQRLKDNINIFDFELDEEAMTTLIGLHCNRRFIITKFKNAQGVFVFADT